MVSQSRSPRALAALVVALAAGALGCVSPTDPWAHLDALEDAQKRYTAAIRWGDLEKAAQWVEPELREQFLSLSAAFADIRITDHEIGEVDLDPDGKSRAEVDVTYLGYALPYYVERRIRERQVWLRDETLGDHRWRVRPELESVIAGMGIAR